MYYLTLLIALSSFCTFYYTFQRENEYKYPIIKKRLLTVILGILFNTIFMSLVWMLLIIAFKIEFRISIVTIVTAIICGALPNRDLEFSCA